MRTKWKFVSPKFHKALAVRAWERETLFNSYLLHVFFGILKNFSTPNYLEFRKFLAITLKGTVNTFHKKNQRCPKSTHKLPMSPFSKYVVMPCVCSCTELPPRFTPRLLLPKPRDLVRETPPYRRNAVCLPVHGASS